jgi:hypothetical protein
MGDTGGNVDCGEAGTTGNGAVVGWDCAPLPSAGCPQTGQNRGPGGTGCPHAVQNRGPGGTGCPYAGLPEPAKPAIVTAG